MPRFRIGCVPFLNARPLIAYYSTDEGREEADILFAPPSDFGDWIRQGLVDVALASSFFAVAEPGYLIAPGASISSQGAVDSVRLFSKVPFADIQKLALDAASMTSNNLAQILLSKKFDCRPNTIVMSADIEAMLADNDACVMIGDAGMDADGTGLSVLDLGAAWDEFCGFPFVWAVWMGADGLSPALCESLERAKEYGKKKIESVARAESDRLGWPFARCLRYLAEVIDFDLGPRHLQGLELFGKLCKEEGLVTESHPIRLVGEAAPR